MIDGAAVELRVSLGIIIADLDGEPAAALARADEMMYASKHTPE
jgi:GGDEF domain-containing protein